jgi:hypothetical protein
MNCNEVEVKIVETIVRYRQMESSKAGSSMLREVRWQYADMAEGGDGGFLWSDEDGNEVTCRKHNYPDYPDSFFQEVRDLMGWQ